MEHLFRRVSSSQTEVPASVLATSARTEPLLPRKSSPEQVVIDRSSWV